MIENMGFITGRKNKGFDDENDSAGAAKELAEDTDSYEEDDFSEIVQDKKKPEKDISKEAEDKASEKEDGDNRPESENKQDVPAVERGEFLEAVKKEFKSAADMSEQENIGGTENDMDSDFDSDFDSEPTESQPDTPRQETEDDKELKRARKKEKKNRSYEMKKKSVKIICFAAGVIIAAAAGVYIYGYNSVPVDVIADNVYIETVPVGGLTFDEAVAKLNSTQLLADKIITVVCADNTYSISGSEVGLVAKVDETVDYAMRYGKTGNRFIDGYVAAIQLIFPHTINPKANVDEGLIREKLAEFGKQIYGDRIEHSLEFGDGVVIASAGRTGFDTNTDTAYQQVLEAIQNEKYNHISVDLQAGPPAELTLDQVDGFVYKDPVDAYYQVSNNEVMVIAEETGRYINRDEAASLITQVVEGAPNVTIPYYVSEAAIKADTLQSKLFNATLGSYSTNYGSSNANRAANVANAARRINGKILGAGEVFSFNTTVGRRTVENGFKEAPEYSNGQTVQGIGGGTCQVSSTLYNAVLYSDLGIVYRLNHMFPVSYCPLGQDATVSDSGVDFKFVNNTDYPVKITANANGGTITVSIVGTQRDVPHKVKISNTSRAVGADTSVQSVRYVYNPSGEMIRQESLGNSYYMAHE